MTVYLEQKCPIKKKRNESNRHLELANLVGSLRDIFYVRDLPERDKVNTEHQTLAILAQNYLQSMRRNISTISLQNYSKAMIRNKGTRSERQKSKEIDSFEQITFSLSPQSLLPSAYQPPGRASRQKEILVTNRNVYQNKNCQSRRNK